jgi:hypothetical protein
MDQDPNFNFDFDPVQTLLLWDYKVLAGFVKGWVVRSGIVQRVVEDNR